MSHHLLFLASHPVDHIENYGFPLTISKSAPPENNPYKGVPNDASQVSYMAASNDTNQVSYMAASNDTSQVYKVHDVPAVINIKGQTITVRTTNVGGGSFTSKAKYDFYTLMIPGAENVQGTLYCFSIPEGDTQFWVQQYPTYFGEKGRIVVEFWNGSEITAVFKTDEGNFGAQGTGLWTRPLPPKP